MFGLFKKKKQVDARFSQPLAPEAEQFLAEALEEYQQKKDALERDWHESASADSELDDAAGVLRVKLADGSGWQADAQILGSFNGDDQTWQWAWGNPECAEIWSRDSKQVKAMAEGLGIWYAHEEWWLALPGPEFVPNLCAIGLKASGSDAGVEVLDGSIMIFVLLKNLRRTSGQAEQAPAEADPQQMPEDLTEGIRLIKDGRDDLLPAWLERFGQSELYVISIEKDNPSNLMVIGPEGDKNYICVFTDSAGLQNAVRDRHEVLFPLKLNGKELLRQARDSGRGLVLNPRDLTVTVALPARMVARFFEVISME